MAAVAALLVVPVLSSCGVNFGAQTDKVYTAAQGVNNRDGQVDVLNALIVSSANGSGRLIAGLSNNDGENPDQLTGVAGSGDDASLTVALQGGNTTIPAGGYIQLADDGQAAVLVSGEAVTAGGYVRVAFSFKRGEQAVLNVPVVSNTGDFADVVIPTPSATPSQQPKG